MLKPTIIMMVTLGMGMIFRSDYSLFYPGYQKLRVMLYEVTDTIDTYVFRAPHIGNQYGHVLGGSFLPVHCMLCHGDDL